MMSKLTAELAESLLSFRLISSPVKYTGCECDGSWHVKSNYKIQDIFRINKSNSWSSNKRTLYTCTVTLSWHRLRTASIDNVMDVAFLGHRLLIKIQRQIDGCEELHKGKKLVFGVTSRLYMCIKDEFWLHQQIIWKIIYIWRQSCPLGMWRYGCYLTDVTKMS